MKIAFESDFKSKTFCTSKSYALLKEKEEKLLDFKFYQNLFIVIVSLSTILIFPESPRELENICMNHNSRKSCHIL
tara:strand:- start:172 stop:399 length:228 start_codon:yes stop_codon:yes gene_type:complete